MSDKPTGEKTVSTMFKALIAVGMLVLLCGCTAPPDVDIHRCWKDVYKVDAFWYHTIHSAGVMGGGVRPQTWAMMEYLDLPKDCSPEDVLRECTRISRELHPSAENIDVLKWGWTTQQQIPCEESGEHSK